MAINNTTNGGVFKNDGTILNNNPVIRAAIYSEMMQEMLYDGFLPEGLHRDVSEFSDGSRIIIPQLGEVVVTDVAEDSDMSVNNQQKIDISSIELRITQYKGAMTAITDELKQDSYKAAQIEAAMPRKHMRAIKLEYEGDLLATAGGQEQTKATTKLSDNAYSSFYPGGVDAGKHCVINGVPHRWTAAGSAQQITLDDFISAKLALDKANVPYEGRIAIVDPVVEATLNTLVGSYAFSNQQHWENVLETGFAKNNKFVGNIFGFDVYVSNRVHTLGASDADLQTFAQAYSGATAVPVDTAGLKANVFMSIVDDEAKPLMGAWRKKPGIEGHRNVALRRDEFYSTARWGFGIQRPEAVVTIATSGTAY